VSNAPNIRTADAPSVGTWRWVAALLAVSQLIAPVVANALAGDFLRSGPTNEALITPAGYAFSVWGVITALCVITAVAVLRFGLGSPWETAFLVDASVVFVGFSAWLWVAAQGWLWITVAVFIVMVSGLIHIMQILVRRRQDLTCAPWLATFATTTFGLYLGWSSVAVFANVAAALITSGASASAVWWQLLVLSAAAAFAIGLAAMLRGSLGYVAGALWALVGVALGAWARDSMVLVTAAAVAAVAVSTVAVVARHRRSALSTREVVTD
jgi:hypothetical protein